MKIIYEKQQEDGITLIALVITIIVLLILASVSIATLTGENGLLTKATNASKETKLASDKEELEIAILGNSNIEDFTVDYDKLQEELKGWEIDAENEKATSPEGNVFNIRELFGNAGNTDDTTDTKVYLDPSVWKEPKIDETTNTATLEVYKGPKDEYNGPEDLELIPQELIIPNYIKDENGDIPIKTLGAGITITSSDWWYHIWADSICDNKAGGYYGCPSRIKKVVISNGIETINEFALASSDLVEVEIPNTVKYIKRAAFVGCDNLQKIYYRGSMDEWRNIDIDMSNGGNDALTEEKVQQNYK